jgi:hypothetical protein
LPAPGQPIRPTTRWRGIRPLSTIEDIGWIHLTLDDMRQALWPPDRQMYWEVRRRGYDDE